MQCVRSRWNITCLLQEGTTLELGSLEQTLVYVRSAYGCFLMGGYSVGTFGAVGSEKREKDFQKLEKYLLNYRKCW